MANEHHRYVWKKMGDFFHQSSQIIFKRLMQDQQAEQKREAILAQVRKAVTKDSLAVLQLIEKYEDSHDFVTIAGWILRYQEDTQQIAVRLNKSDQIRVIPLAQIRRISLVNLRHPQE